MRQGFQSSERVLGQGLDVIVFNKPVRIGKNNVGNHSIIKDTQTNQQAIYQSAT